MRLSLGIHNRYFEVQNYQMTETITFWSSGLTRNHASRLNLFTYRMNVGLSSLWTSFGHASKSSHQPTWSTHDLALTHLGLSKSTKLSWRHSHPCILGEKNYISLTFVEWERIKYTQIFITISYIKMSSLKYN